MMFHRRRVLILSVLATLVAGTAVASRGTRWLSSTGQISPAPALANTKSVSSKSRSDLNAPPLQMQTGEPVKSSRRQFTVYRDESGEVVCREATPDEIRDRQAADPQKLGLRQINHFEFDKSVSAQSPEAANLIIVLRATQQLQQNAAATAAFTRAAQNWESLIMSPVTVYIDVDFGTTNFGQSWPANVLGATGSPSSSFAYQSVRTNLNAEATSEGNATKQAIFNALPATTVPTDLGNASAVDVSNSIARAIGLLPATAQPSDDAPQIAFNSNNTFDFDPSDGITAGAIDFDAVVTHEIGHALGFDSDGGLNAAKPTVWDLYRFRTGTTSSTFPTAPRILTVGGSPDPLQFYFLPGNVEMGLSTGGPNGSSNNGADGWQSSHWKHVSTCTGYIGIMDPAISNGCRRTITSNDTLALGSFGYNLLNSAAPPPPPPSPTPPANDNFANAQVISGCSGSTNGSTFGATKETGEPSHDPTDSTSLSPGHTVWYQWQAPSSGTTTITTAGSDFDTILAVYTGTTVGSLTRLTFNDDVQNGVIRTSTVTFSATSGTVYRIAVDGWGGDVGSVQLNWTGCPSTPTPTPTPSPTPTPTPTLTPTPSPTPVVCPGTLIVNDAGDGSDANPGNGVCATSGGACTLRAAIEESNALGSCGTITINLSSVPGTINLGSALPAINHNVNLNGPNGGQQVVQRSSVAGTPNFRIFAVNSGRTVTMSQLTIARGLFPAQNGGGVLNSGTLTLTNCNVYGNSVGNQDGFGQGGGISNNGSLTLNNCQIGGTAAGQGNVSGANGGGISSTGFLTMNGGAVAGNSVSGISVVGGSAALSQVSITNNTATQSGGGIMIVGTTSLLNVNDSLIANNSASGGGGGIYNSGAQATVINSTISGNTSGSFAGGIQSFNGTSTTLINATVTNNRCNSGSGGLINSGQVIIKNSIVSGNFTGSTGTVASDVQNSVNSGSSFNLIGSCNSCGLSNGVSGNQVGVTNPGLVSLANNGGPTSTHALMATSPAINAGSNALALNQSGAPIMVDQRGVGFPRIVGGTIDIGAYEAGNPIDEASFFVKQQYLDFLNRQPDQSGWDFWTNQITSCGGNAQCIEAQRVNVSAAFFLSIEFQQTGNLVYKMYKAGFGNLPGKPVAVDRAPFLTDTRQIQSTPAQLIVGQGNWQAQLETNKQAFTLAFVQRSNFQTQHGGQTASDYVQSLFTNTGASPTTAETTAGVTAFNNAGGGDAGRAAALRSVAESSSVTTKLNNEAFVLMQYFGYLQRNPYDPPESTLDYSGFNFWLGKLNQFNGDYLAAELVKAFITSSEYRQRFGP